MKLDLSGSELFESSPEILWEAINDPAVLTRCIPGCNQMILTGEDVYKVLMNLKVAAVGGSFEGEVSLSEKNPPTSCTIRVSGAGTLGHGAGEAHFQIAEEGTGSRLTYSGNGEIGGLVAGVGQRVLGSVSKHLVKRFFTSFRAETASPTREDGRFAAD